MNIDYILHLADNNLVLAQRNGEWCGHGPVLEQDIAITNITLDILGQARLFYQHTATLLAGKSGEPVTEDSLAYLRTEREFKNFLLAEIPDTDWAHTVLRQYLFSQFNLYLYRHLLNDDDEQIAAIAAKSLKEITYHVKWSSEWVIRLGDGTEESNKRLNAALHALWMYTGEFCIPAQYETSIPLNTIKEYWLNDVTEVFAEAGITVPENVFMQTGGKNGIHTEHLGYLLSEMQYLQRTYPNAQW